MTENRIKTAMDDKKRPQGAKASASARMTPSERVAKVVLAGIGWVRELLTTFRTARPTGQVIHHHGHALPAGKEVRFSKILVVEDNSQTALAVADIIRKHYAYGEIGIYLAHCFQTAASFFSAHDIGLVIMDSDLNDERGDGMALTAKFHAEKPQVVILANSSSRISNMKLESCGASGSVSKNHKQLLTWLQENDRTGAAPLATAR